MSGPPLAAIVVPIVATAALFMFLALVLYADSHPWPGRGGAPDRNVTREIFPGGPQQQPSHLDAPAPEAASQGGHQRDTGQPERPEQ